MWRESQSIMIVLAAVAAGCGSSGSASTAQSAGRPASTPSNTTPAVPLVGRWEQTHTCQALVQALDKAHLSATGPAVIRDYFPNSSPKQLAAKHDLCSGATPQVHSHFFTVDGMFGSLDQDSNQVDDGSYEIINDHTLRIGDGTFDFTIANGDTLILKPVITAANRHKALASPLEFSTAAWQVAVTYSGLPWKRADCDGWC
jgi:hypothetical protein